jgi:UDP-3-O-acyl-N-acetylglucosamine deacetylase
MSPAPVPARTLARPVTLSGQGLFSPLPATLVIHQRPPERSVGPGVPSHAAPLIDFTRVDVTGSGPIPANVRCVAPPQRQGTFGRNTVLVALQAQPAPGPSIHTTEHLLSAAYALAFFDLRASIDGPEIPLLDGSALAFFSALASAASPALVPGPTPLLVTSPVAVEDEAGASIRAQPLDLNALGALGVANRASPPGPRCLVIDYTLDYAAAAAGSSALGALGPRAARFVLDWDDPVGTAQRFAAQIAPARTFCTEAEARAFQASGRFAHVDARHVLVLGADDQHPGGIASGGPMTLPDEPARHKVLDAIGDLALVGRPIVGHIVACRSGHPLNHALAKALLDAFA